MVNDFLVLQGQGRQLRRQSKDDMQVARSKQFAAACFEPGFAGGCLALWAVTISTVVIRVGDTMSAADALIDRAAESRRAAAGNGQQHFDVRPAYPAAIVLDESSSRSADPIGQFQVRPTPLLLLRRPSFQRERVQGTGGGVQVTR
jgi:hypothetical protein